MKYPVCQRSTASNRGLRALFKELILGVPSHTHADALKDLTSHVQEGEAFGVVGDNGAAKTTLLKVLTGAAFPTTGTVSVGSSVSALLEFGPDFTPSFPDARESISTVL